MTRVGGHVMQAVGAADLVILVQDDRKYDVKALQAASGGFLDTRGIAKGRNRL